MFLNPYTGWTIPTIKSVHFWNIKRHYPPYSKKDGIIELSELTLDITVYFDPIDASEAKLTIFDSFHDNKNTVLNDIKLYRSGMDCILNKTIIII